MSQAINKPGFIAEEVSAALPSQEARSLAAARWGICAILFAVLVIWALIFPYTGDGDSAPHFLNARDSAATPISAMHAWARPGIKLVMAPFSVHGIFATRVLIAVLAALTAWQTMRLAEELGLRNSLLAGPLIVWQPMAFALAADTMTEMPMALGIVTAIRLWRNGWWRTSALLVGYLPSVRPEGFFLGVLWGAMILFAPAPVRRRRNLDAQHGASEAWNILLRISALACLTVGLIAWAAACWALTFNHDMFYVLHIWNWPPGSYAAYGKGSLLHHVIRWPIYCGVLLCVVFALGIKPSWRREMMLPWAVWGIVFGVHSILYWGGWFASCGIMRIFTCTAPVTALICLYGWNAAERWLIDRQARLSMKSSRHGWIDHLLRPRTAGIVAGGIRSCSICWIRFTTNVSQSRDAPTISIRTSSWAPTRRSSPATRLPPRCSISPDTHPT